MTRTMVYLEDKLHRNLKHLAVERRTSLAALIREAVASLYCEDLEDLRIGRQRRAEYLKHPERVIPYERYRAERLSSGR